MENVGCPLHSQKSGWVSTTLHDLGAGGARNGHSVTCTWGRAEWALAWLRFCVSFCFCCLHFSAIHPSLRPSHSSLIPSSHPLLTKFTPASLFTQPRARPAGEQL